MFSQDELPLAGSSGSLLQPDKMSQVRIPQGEHFLTIIGQKGKEKNIARNQPEDKNGKEEGKGRRRGGGGLG